MPGSQPGHREETDAIGDEKGQLSVPWHDVVRSMSQPYDGADNQAPYESHEATS